MKKIVKTMILMAAITVSFTSCKKDFLEQSPTGAVATEVAFSTTTNAWAAVNGIHRAMYNQIFGVQAQGGQSGNMLYMDIMGDDMIMNTAASSWLRDEYKWISHRNPNSNMLYYNYTFYYVIIGNANMILANIDNASGSAADKAIIKGQALAYRGWAYFQMVQLFGERFVNGQPNASLAVPLVLSPSTEVSPRSTVAQVYTQINKDIDEAIVALASYTRANKSHLNVNVAKGIKARIALTQQDWPNAVKFAQEARAGFTLMSNTQYLAGFNNYTNPEWMWSSRIQSDQTNYFYSFFAYMSSNFNALAIRTSPKSINSTLYDWIPSTDVRKGLWDPTGTNTTFPIPTPASSRYKFMSRKFRVADQSLSIGDVPYMRAAEMFLIEAEAQARRGGNDGLAAQALYTLAVNRDPSYTLSTKTGADLITEIMNHRRVELWGEGFRFYDLKRTNSPLDRTGANHNVTIANEMSIAASEKTWQFLIPQREINTGNGVIEQNPQ
jgi:hypothetical protein